MARASISLVSSGTLGVCSNPLWRQHKRPLPLLRLADNVVGVWLLEVPWEAQFIAGGLGCLGCIAQPAVAYRVRRTPGR